MTSKSAADVSVVVRAEARLLHELRVVDALRVPGVPHGRDDVLATVEFDPSPGAHRGLGRLLFGGYRRGVTVWAVVLDGQIMGTVLGISLGCLRHRALVWLRFGVT